VVFEDTFDELVEQIRHDQFMNISLGEAMGKWLKGQLLRAYIKQGVTDNNI
jgi:hypothetical protein